MNLDWLTEDTWIIADTHFFHVNIQKYANRPANHMELMISAWNQLVQPDDNILHLGDVFLGKREQIEEIAPLLRGNKFLIKGNHDSRKKLHKLLGFTCFEEDELLFKRFGKFLLIFSHVPIHKIKHPLTYNIHGHIHQRNSPTENHVNMCVEVREYRPWRLGSILQEIEERHKAKSNSG